MLNCLSALCLRTLIAKRKRKASVHQKVVTELIKPIHVKHWTHFPTTPHTQAFKHKWLLLMPMCCYWPHPSVGCGGGGGARGRGEGGGALRSIKLRWLWLRVREEKLAPAVKVEEDAMGSTFLPKANRMYILIPTQGQKKTHIVKIMNISFPMRLYKLA